MLVERSVELGAPAQALALALGETARKDLAEIVGAATSAGESLLQQSGMTSLDEAYQCHFGAQLGRPWAKGENTTFPLRWWNDKSRSLTPGFIGELRLQARPGQVTELSIAGQYHPWAHLYELVSPRLLSRMANTVIGELLQQLQRRLLSVTA